MILRSYLDGLGACCLLRHPNIIEDMVQKGIIQGKHIELDEETSIPSGSRVTVQIVPEVSPKRGSPAALLRLAGTLSAQESDSILEAVKQCRHIDERMWSGG